MKKLGPVFLLVILISCSKAVDFKVINLHDISKNEDCKTIPLDSIVTSSEVIELDNYETAPIIGVISSMYESDKSFYIVSDEKFVYEYDKSGKYIRQIGTQGRGPGEYLYVEGISVNKQDSTINIFDFTCQKFLKFDKDGHFMFSFKPKFADTLLYLQSFFPYKDSLLFYTSNNSERPDLFLFDQSMEVMETISTKNRSMLPGELILGNVIIFGDSQNPYIYNYFNDTIYTIYNRKLMPSMIARTGKMRFEYEELFMEKLGNSGQSRLQMSKIVKGENLILFCYTISNKNEKVRNRFLSLYNSKTGNYTQNIQIRDDKNSIFAISGQDLIFQGSTSHEIVVIKGNLESDKNPVILKFKLK